MSLVLSKKKKEGIVDQVTSQQRLVMATEGGKSELAEEKSPIIEKNKQNVGYIYSSEYVRRCMMPKIGKRVSEQLFIFKFINFLMSNILFIKVFFFKLY